MQSSISENVAYAYIVLPDYQMNLLLLIEILHTYSTIVSYKSMGACTSVISIMI